MTLKQNLWPVCVTSFVVFLVSLPINAQTTKTSRFMPAIYHLLLEDAEPITPEEASRFLTQATYGAKYSDIQALTKSSYSSWIDAQLKIQPTLLYDFMVANDWADPTTVPPIFIGDGRDSSWLLVSSYADDQLRQRMAFALSEIFVVSDKVDSALTSHNNLFVNYYDVLLENAFVNYRDLLETITLNGVMGEYLSMAGSGKASATVNRPDENYAREVMQLFTIGLWELNIDGTQKLAANGKPIPSYEQADVEEFAKVFTGWDQTRCETFAATCQFPSTAPMRLYQNHHDVTSKTLLSVDGLNPVLLANQTGESDLNNTLDILFNHPNVGPFIGKQLIQRFVTSNPSPAYVARVATVFNNNGKGVRGDMAAVIKSILMDTEARNGHKNSPNTFGKFKEPLLRITALWRALDMRKETLFRGQFALDMVNIPGQFPTKATTVFNFFRPDFSPPGVLAQNNLLAPEGQLLDLESMVSMSRQLYHLVQSNDAQSNSFNDGTNKALIYTSALQSMVPDNLQQPAALIDHLNLTLLAGAMRNDVRTVLLNFHNGDAGYAASNKTDVVLDIAQLIVTSPAFLVQR